LESEETRKISWINWDIIFLKNENGGLRATRFREFNLSLLGKWFWRLDEEKGFYGLEFIREVR